MFLFILLCCIHWCWFVLGYVKDFHFLIHIETRRGNTMTLLIKNLALSMGCIFFQHKLLNLSFTRKHLLFYSCLLPAITIASAYIDFKQSHANILFTVICITGVAHIFHHKSIHTAITTAFFAFALSFAFHVFASIIITTSLLPIADIVTPIFVQVACLIIYLLLIPLPFRIPRLQSGMPFLENPIYSMPGAFLSITIIYIATVVNSKTYHFTLVTLIMTIPLLTLSIYHYWKQYITKTYRDEITLRNLSELNHTIQEQQQIIQDLKDEKERLERIVHKDNRLIPAMELSVRNFLSTPSLSEPAVTKRGQELLQELNRLSKERSGILKEQVLNCEHIKSTKVTSIDNMLHYLQQDAFINDITLQANISCDIRDLIQHAISEEDLNTLLADLIKNAIIATKCNNGHFILLSIHLLSNNYAISVFDSGIPFPPEVWAKWGKERVTTHANDGGSGIGMMTIHELLNKYRGSFVIHEFHPDSSGYTKEISVLFDHCSQCSFITKQ